jgi:BirA family transcriptional regulator, biotin operon repressor / biotin---[acetyl-CoA-carboxylase] ligase
MGVKGAKSEFGRPHRHLRCTDSTIDRARELAEAGAPHGTVVTAAEQSAGRGRQGRTWTAPAGRALLYSAILRPLDERHLLLPLAVPIAVCEAAEELEDGLECAIKWPNDVWVAKRAEGSPERGRKLAGVLIEAKPQDGWAVIGVGLNLGIEPGEFPPELRDTATSLSLPGDGAGSGDGDPERAAARERARRALDAALGRWVGATEGAVLGEWRRRDALRGREVAWDGGSGVADGVDDRGCLVVVVPGGGRVSVGAGEVHLRL